MFKLNQTKLYLPSYILLLFMICYCVLFYGLLDFYVIYTCAVFFILSIVSISIILYFYNIFIYISIAYLNYKRKACWTAPASRSRKPRTGRLLIVFQQAIEIHSGIHDKWKKCYFSWFPVSFNQKIGKTTTISIWQRPINYGQFLFISGPQWTEEQPM